MNLIERLKELKSRTEDLKDYQNISLAIASLKYADKHVKIDEYARDLKHIPQNDLDLHPTTSHGLCSPLCKNADHLYFLFMYDINILFRKGLCYSKLDWWISFYKGFLMNEIKIKYVLEVLSSNFPGEVDSLSTVQETLEERGEI